MAGKTVTVAAHLTSQYSHFQPLCHWWETWPQLHLWLLAYGYTGLLASSCLLQPCRKHFTSGTHCTLKEHIAPSYGCIYSFGMHWMDYSFRHSIEFERGDRVTKTILDEGSPPNPTPTTHTHDRGKLSSLIHLLGVIAGKLILCYAMNDVARFMDNMIRATEWSQRPWKCSRGWPKTTWYNDLTRHLDSLGCALPVQTEPNGGSPGRGSYLGSEIDPAQCSMNNSTSRFKLQFSACGNKLWSAFHKLNCTCRWHLVFTKRFCLSLLQRHMGRTFSLSSSQSCTDVCLFLSFFCW